MKKPDTQDGAIALLFSLQEFHMPNTKQSSLNDELFFMTNSFNDMVVRINHPR